VPRKIWVSDLNTFLLLTSDPGMEALVGGIRLHLRAPLNQIPVEAIFDELEPSVSESGRFSQGDYARKLR
jgi:hypothetical protein